MTVGKYYCDYCDKEFQDTSAARKRHLQGILHQRNRKLWYDSLSSGVLSIWRFLPTHNMQAPTNQGKSRFSGSSQPPEGVSLQGRVVRQCFGMSLGNLPPSLMPPPEGGHPSLPFVDWG